MRRLLFRYLAADMVAPLFAWLAGLVLMLEGNFMFLLLKAAVGRPLPWEPVVRFLAFRVPFAIVLSLPMAYLFAAALSINRFSRDNELVAMRMGGMSPRAIMAPYILIGFICFVAGHVTYDRLMPWAQYVATDALRDMFDQPADVRPAEDFFIRPDGSDYMFYAREVGDESHVLHDVILCKIYPNSFPEFTVATTAMLDDSVWTLNDARKFRFDELGFIESSGFSSSITVDLKEILDKAFEQARGPEEQSMVELMDTVEKKEAGGRPAFIERHEMHRKVSLPLACLVFAFVICPLAMRYSSGSFTGMLLAAGTLFFYYLFMTWCQVLAYGGTIDPALGAWIHDGVLAVIGIILFVRAR